MTKDIKIVYFVNTDWFFLSHRLPLAITAKEKGYEVHIVVNELTKIKDLRNTGLIIHHLKSNRKSWNPIDFIFLTLRFLFLIKKIRPKLIHCITMKPSISGTMASLITKNINVVISITGLGEVFSNNSAIDKFKQFIIVKLLNFVFNKKKLKVIFQNKDDKKFILNKTQLKDRDTYLFKGSGVNLKDLKFKPLSNQFPKVLFASRLIYSKGIKEFIEASTMVKGCEFIIAGKFDRGNPKSLNKADLEHLIAKYPIEYVGYQEDIRNLIYSSSIVVLPSYYREGLPKILIEAAACGRPIITTNNVGCKDAVIHQKTGILIPIKNSIKLAEAIVYLIKNKKILKDMGKEGRKFAVKNFDIDKITSGHLKIYEDLINE